MDIEYIKRFIVVSECMNFSKAAEQMFISQPTLSHSISALEKKLGTPLFVRNTKRVKFTRAGELFLPAAKEIVAIYERTANEIAHEMDVGNEMLNIGYIGPTLDTRFTGWVKAFRAAWPEARVHIEHYPTSAIAELFENHRIHLGILYKMNTTSIQGLKFQEVGQERFRVCISADHPLAQQERIELSQLRDETFLICERPTSPNYYDRIRTICSKRGFEPARVQKVRLVGDIYRLAGLGLGVAIMSYSEARSYESYNIKFVEIDDEEDLINSVVIAWKDSLSFLARQFRDTAKGTAAQAK